MFWLQAVVTTWGSDHSAAEASLTWQAKADKENNNYRNQGMYPCQVFEVEAPPEPSDVERAMQELTHWPDVPWRGNQARGKDDPR